MHPRGRVRVESAPTAAMGAVVTPRIPETNGSRTERYGELEGHRAIAVVGIVIFHVYQFCDVSDTLYRGTPADRILGSLDAMVPWFYVLTAFLLFEPIARSLIEGGRPIPVGAYLRRRAVRIIPAYYLAVFVVWFSRQQSLPGDWHDLLEHLTFTQVFDSKRIFYTIGPASALSVEVYFYLALAVLAVALARACRLVTRRNRRVVLLASATALLAAASVAWKAWSYAVGNRPPSSSPTTWLGPMANFDVFAVGMALAIAVGALGGLRPFGARGRAALRLAGLAVLVVAFLTRQGDSWSGVYFYSECAIGFGCLVAGAVLGPQDRWGRALGCRALTWLGAISYGIFLWHEPIMLSMRTWDGLVRQTQGAFVRDAIVVLIATVGAGWLSYTLIERPASRLGGLFNGDGRLSDSLEGTGRKPVDWETFATGNPF